MQSPARRHVGTAAPRHDVVAQRVRATGVLRGQLGSQRRTFAFVLLSDAAQGVRLDLLDPIAGVVGTLRCDATTLQWYMPMTNTVYRAAPTAKAMQHLLGVRLPPLDLVRALLGQATADHVVVEFRDKKPARAVVHTAHGKEMLVLDYDAVELNPQWSGDSWQLSVPDGTRVRQW